MSIDEVMEIASRFKSAATRVQRHAQDDQLRAAITQHVAEAVEKEIERRARIIESQDACPSFCNRMATRRAARVTP